MTSEELTAYLLKSEAELKEQRKHMEKSRHETFLHGQLFFVQHLLANLQRDTA